MIPPQHKWPDLPRTRAQAKTEGSAHYFTGQPCSGKSGPHVEPRSASTWKCTGCRREEARERRLAKMESTESPEAYREADSRKRMKRRHANIDGWKEYRRERRKQRLDADQLRHDRTPPNQSAEEREAIKAFSADARLQGMVPDHIVPFLHPELAGLHVLANLQIFDPGANKQKGNRVQYSPEEAADHVASGRAVWRKDVNEETGQVDWSQYPQHLPPSVDEAA